MEHACIVVPCRVAHTLLIRSFSFQIAISNWISRIEAFIDTMTFPGSPSISPYLEAINNFVFGEMWPREGLDQRSRRAQPRHPCADDHDMRSAGRHCAVP